jgi:hypothetical protein
VLKKRLALVSPTLVADAFMYEEGPDLEADEAAESAAFRPVALAALPGGGIRNGAIVAVSDQAQAFEAQLVVSHRVGDWTFAAENPVERVQRPARTVVDLPARPAVYYNLHFCHARG